MRTVAGNTITRNRGKGGGRPAKYPWDQILSVDGYVTDENGDTVTDDDGNPVPVFKALEQANDFPDSTVASFVSNARRHAKDGGLTLETVTMFDEDTLDDAEPTPIGVYLRVEDANESDADESSANESDADHADAE